MQFIKHLFTTSISLFLFALPTNAQEKFTPIIEDGQAQIITAFKDGDEWIKEAVWVETDFDSDQDGSLDRMHVFITRQKQTEKGNLKLPVIYQSSPYFGLRMIDLVKDKPQKYAWDVRVELGEEPKPHKKAVTKRREKRSFMAYANDKKWIPRGFITVYSSSPGTGLSDGVPSIGGENESLAPKAVIDWLCGRAKGYKTRRGNQEVKAFWSNGKVGMIGTSYDGTLALAAATTGVKGLKAIVPIAPVSSFYHYYRSNGLVKSPGGYKGEDMDVLYEMIHTADNNKRAKNNKIMRDEILIPKQDRATGDYNDFWASRDLLSNFSNTKAAMLIAHGFNDWNVMPEQTYRIFKAAKDKQIPVQLYYHQKGHGGEPPMKILNRWFTRYLHGIENDVESDEKVWIEHIGDDYPSAYIDYPDPKAHYVALYTKKVYEDFGQLLSTKQKDQGKQTFVDNYKLSGSELVESNNSKHRLLFVSQPLKKDIRISGVAKVKIKLACNKSSTNLSVWLVSLPWDGDDKAKTNKDIISRGWMDPQNRNSLWKSEPLEPNKFYNLNLDLQPDDQIIKAGEQLGLMIFASDQEFTLHPKPGTMLSIDLDETYIEIPFVGELVFEE